MYEILVIVNVFMCLLPRDQKWSMQCQQIVVLSAGNLWSRMVTHKIAYKVHNFLISVVDHVTLLFII